jgi:hypothetical protein
VYETSLKNFQTALKETSTFLKEEYEHPTTIQTSRLEDYSTQGWDNSVAMVNMKKGSGDTDLQIYSSRSSSNLAMS